MKAFITIMILCVFLSSCTNNENDTITPVENNSADDYTVAENDDSQLESFSTLLQTGEIYTAEEMEELKSQAVSWQSSTAGIGGFADIVAIEPEDGSDQQVFISVDYKVTYERIEIQTPEGVQARIISTSSGAGSCEIEIGYKLVSDDFEWVEFFYTYANTMEDYAMQWGNITKANTEYANILNELSPEERQFK